MNPDLLDDPDFTAYALGEATLEQSTRVRQRLASNPAVRAEFDALQATIDALQQAPVLPKLALHPRQRETVLTMGQIKSLPPATLHPNHRPKRSYHTLLTVSKYAAAAAVAVGAFVVGQHFSIPAEGIRLQAGNTDASSPSTPDGNFDLVSAADTPLVTLSDPSREKSHQQNLISKTGLLPEAKVETPDIVTLPDAAVLSPAPAGATLASISPSTKSPTENTAPAAKLPVPTNGFTLSSESANSRFLFKPNDARRSPSEFAGVILASPTPVISPPAAKKPVKRDEPQPQPQLLIRSWKAEIASCPWDERRRLMRLVVQIPLDQPALEFNEADYSLQTSFDPKLVKAHRLVAEKHLRPVSGRDHATRIVWYELVLNPGVQVSETHPQALGKLLVLQPQARSGSASQPPSKASNDTVNDNNDLLLVDRGHTWNIAREDFVFETAMVGFGLLLQGTENIGTLNHDLVLDLAERSSDAPPTGERARFIQSVHQAQRAAGL